MTLFEVPQVPIANRDCAVALIFLSEPDSQNTTEGVNRPEFWRCFAGLVRKTKSKVLGQLKDEAGSKHVVSILYLLKRQEVKEIICKDKRVVQVQGPSQKVQSQCCANSRCQAQDG